MRIAIDARLIHYRPGGIAEYTRHLITELAALDQESEYLVLHHARAQETLTPAVNFKRVNVFTPSHHRLERWSLTAELLPRRLNLLHSPDLIPPAGGARKRVITVHDLHFLHYPQYMTAESLRYYRDQAQWAVRTADHILVDSAATRQDLINLLHVPAEKMTVHMLGVTSEFKPLPENIVQDCRKRYGLPSSYLLFVGTYEPRKNIAGLLDAYHLLCQTHADLPPLVLVGRRGWLYEDIFAKVEALKLSDRLIWVENAPFPDLPALYNGGLALVLPSHYEGFGLTPLEAMACGTPVIISNRGSLPEVVGDTGLLVNPDDPADVAASIERLLTDSALRSHLSAAGLARAALFTWRRTAEQTLAVYRHLLS